MFKTYIVNGREYFVCDETKKDFPFPESLLRFLYLDSSQYDLLAHRMARSLEEYYPTRDEMHLNDVIKGLDTLAEEHIYFQYLREEWRQKMEAARMCQPGEDFLSDLLPRKELSRLHSEISQIQKQIKAICAAVLDKDNAQQTLEEYYSSKSSSLLTYSFLPLKIDFTLTDEGVFADVLSTNRFYELISFSLQECIKRGVQMRVCKNCGRYFALSGKGTAEYCEITLDEKGRTCKETGAMKKYSVSKKDNPIFSEYRREYKRRFAWIKTGRIDSTVFYAWSAEARQKEAECERGQITFEEFKAWLARP